MSVGEFASKCQQREKHLKQTGTSWSCTTLILWWSWFTGQEERERGKERWRESGRFKSPRVWGRQRMEGGENDGGQNDGALSWCMSKRRGWEISPGGCNTVRHYRGQQWTLWSCYLFSITSLFSSLREMWRRIITEAVDMSLKPAQCLNLRLPGKYLNP